MTAADDSSGVAANDASSLTEVRPSFGDVRNQSPNIYCTYSSVTADHNGRAV
jgi:hypothetical protein